MTLSKKDHSCRKVVLGELDQRIAKILKNVPETICLSEILKGLDQDGGPKVHEQQLRKRLKSLSRQDIVKVRKSGGLIIEVGKGQFFVNFSTDD